MKTKIVKYLFVIFFLCGIRNHFFCQNNNYENPFRGISLDGAHYIATEVNTNKNIKTTISLINQDSTFNYVFFDGLFYVNEKIIITEEKFVVDIKKKYPDSIIFLLPEIKSGIYYFLYESKSEKFSLKFLNIK
jgi:hypothetical protein